MYINKEKLKKLVATGTLIVTTMTPCIGKAFSYKVTGNDNLFDIAKRFYGDSKYMIDLMEYNDLNNSNLYNGMIIEIPAFSELTRKYNSKYNFDIIDGIKLNVNEFDQVEGIYIKNRFNNNWGYINCLGYNSSNINQGSLITLAGDCNFTTKGAYISGDGYNFYVNIPLKNGHYEMISLSLVDFNIVKNSNNHKPLRECSNYVLKNNFYVDKDGKITNFTINTTDGQVLNVFVTNPESNFKFDYNNFDYNNNYGIKVVTVNNKIVGFGLLRIDGKYDYVGVSNEFSFDYYDNLFNIDSVKKETFDVKKTSIYKNAKNELISISTLVRISDVTIWKLCKDFYGNGEYSKYIMYFNDIVDARKVVHGQKVYFPPINDLINFYNRFNNDMFSIKNDMINRSIRVEFYDTTLWALASKYYGNGYLYDELMFFNDISDPKKIKNGTIIYIPDLNELLDYCKKYNSVGMELVKKM